LKRKAPVELGNIGALPEPQSRPGLERPYNVAIGGVGGTGVLTIGALLGMAAHVEGKASMILDMSGLAQKGGAVLSHVQLAETTEEVTCSRIVSGTADLLIAADEVVAVAKDTIGLCEAGRTHGVVNTHLIPMAGFVRNRDFNFQTRRVNSVLEMSLRKEAVSLDFTKAAEALIGDSIATNMMMMGLAYQQRLLPLQGASIEQAIELNGVSIKMNKLAFQLGRLAAADPARLASMLKDDDETIAPKTLDEMSVTEVVAHRSAMLTDYQNAKLAERYRALVSKVQAASDGYGDALTRAVAINYAKLLAYKDEYEVARLHTDGRFAKRLAAQFDGDFKIYFNLAPPVLPQERDGPAEETRLRRLDATCAQGACQPARPARHDVRSFRGQRRPQARAQFNCRLREGCRDRACASIAAHNRHRGGAAGAAGPNPWLRAGQGCLRCRDED
jgi:indolepyruvate ferredoxin oxidoreductase